MERKKVTNENWLDFKIYFVLIIIVPVVYKYGFDGNPRDIGFFFFCFFLLSPLLWLLGLTPKSVFFFPSYRMAQGYMKSIKEPTVENAETAKDLILLANKFAYSKSSTERVQILFEEWKEKFNS